MKTLTIFLILLLGKLAFAQCGTGGHVGPIGSGQKSCIYKLSGSGGGARILYGQEAAAKCQALLAATRFSYLNNTTAPQAMCESDGLQGYVKFSAGTLQAAYDRFDLPADWSASLKLVVTAYSAGTTAPTVNVYLKCITNTPVASPSWGAAQPITLSAAPGRTSVSTTLTTTGCTVGDLVEWKLEITAGAASDMRVLGVRFTE